MNAFKTTVIDIVGVLRGLENRVTIDRSEINPDPSLIPDAWKAIDDGHFDDEENDDV